MFTEVKVILILYLFIQSCIENAGSSNENATQDQTSLRPNTLEDDADDIQRQLNNEARGRLNNAQSKTIWVFNLPTQVAESNLATETYRKPRHKEDDIYKKMQDISSIEETFNDQDEDNWVKNFPACSGHSQSPVDLYPGALIKTRGARKLQFFNYDVQPTDLSLKINANKVVVTGQWRFSCQPLIYGGAAHSRRYTFHSLTLHWPSEHTIGGMYYPLETQALHISAEYDSLDEALDASKRDPLAFLGVVTLYKYGNYTHEGLHDILETVKTVESGEGFLPKQPLEYFCPTFKEYACYHGSLTSPPCMESVMWFVRAKALHVTREAVAATRTMFTGAVPKNGRRTQPLNDRKVYYFKS